MAEFIERKALVEFMNECKGNDAFNIMATGYAMAFIEKVPAADVVEVVRCRDCKHYYHGTCTNDFALNLMRENDYCSYGEKRSE